MEGNYTGFDIRTSGSENSSIVFKAVNQNVIVDESNYKTSDGINIENANRIVIDGFKVINQPSAGICAAVSDFIVIKNNYWGIFTGFTNDILIENSICSYSIQQHSYMSQTAGIGQLSETMNASVITDAGYSLMQMLRKEETVLFAMQ